MKRLIAFVLIIAMSASNICAQNNAPVEIENLINKYDNPKEKFDGVTIGSFLMGIMRATLPKKTEEEKKLVEAFKGIKEMVLADYTEAAPEKKKAFNSEVTPILRKMDLIASVKDQKGVMTYVYGTPLKNNSISNVVLFSPDEGLIMLIVGTMDYDKLDTIRNFTTKEVENQTEKEKKAKN